MYTNLVTDPAIQDVILEVLSTDGLVNIGHLDPGQRLEVRERLMELGQANRVFHHINYDPRSAERAAERETQPRYQGPDYERAILNRQGC